MLRIRLVNELPPNRDPLPHDHNLPNRLSTTNLHTHGLHVSPDGIADNVLRETEPGQTYDIEVPIPASHPPGTYWYHPHRHGSANVQVAGGMAGALILEGDFADVPEIARARERVLILQQLAFDALGTVESFDTVWPNQAARLFTVNGQLMPTIAMRPGEVQRWRIIHAGFHDSTPIGLDHHVLHEIAADGIALPRVRTQDSILVVPGQRTDVLVKAGSPGTYALRSLPFDQGEGPNRIWVLARVVVGGDPLPMNVPAALPRDRSRRSARTNSPARARSLSRHDRPPPGGTISASSASWLTIACSIPIGSTSAFASARSRSGRSPISTRPTTPSTFIPIPSS